MKMIVVVILADLVTNFPLSSFLSVLTSQKQRSGFQQVGGAVTRNISIFVCSESRSMPNSIDF